MNTGNDSGEIPGKGVEANETGENKKSAMPSRELVFEARERPLRNDQPVEGGFRKVLRGGLLFAVIVLGLCAGFWILTKERTPPVATEAPEMPREAIALPVEVPREDIALPTEVPESDEFVPSEETALPDIPAEPLDPYAGLREAVAQALQEQDWRGADEAYQELFRAIIADGKELPMDLLGEYGTLMSFRGRRKLALAAFNEMLSRDENFGNGATLNNFAFTLFQLGRNLPEALSASEKALALDPENPSFLHTKGTILIRMKRTDEAIAVLEEAVRLTPPEMIKENWQFHDHLGDAYLQSGNTGKALHHWRMAAAEVPMNGSLWNKIKRYDP